MLPETMSGHGLVWRIGADEELIRFAFLHKVHFTGQQLGLIAKSIKHFPSFGWENSFGRFGR